MTAMRTPPEGTLTLQTLPIAIIRRNNLCEAAVRVKRFILAWAFSAQAHPTHTASSMSSFCPRSIVGRPSARRIVGFGGRGGTISFTASDCRQVIARARLAVLRNSPN